MGHPHVPHPRDLLTAERNSNDWLMEHLSRLFGSPWTVWLFMAVPIVVEYWAVTFQNLVFFYSSAWIQLFALPLLTYIGNKAEKLRAAKADADHAALTSVHTTVDAVRVVNETQDGRLARIETHLGIPAPGEVT